MPENKKKLDHLVSRTKVYLIIIAVILIILSVLEYRAIIP